MKIQIDSALKGAVVMLLIRIAMSIMIIFPGCAERNKDEKAGIGEKGNLNEIIIPENANEVIKFAATELQSYLKKITGKELQIQESDDKKIRKEPSGFNLENDKEIKWDGYSTEVTKKRYYPFSKGKHRHAYWIC